MRPVTEEPGRTEESDEASEIYSSSPLVGAKILRGCRLTTVRHRAFGSRGTLHFWPFNDGASCGDPHWHLIIGGYRELFGLCESGETGDLVDAEN